MYITNKTPYRVEILFDNISWEEACEKEKEFISLYGRINLNNGTLSNMTNGGDGTFGFKWSEESKLNHHSKKNGVKGYFYNKKFTEEHKKNISNSLKGRVYSKETKNKISNSLKGEKHQFYGKPTPISKKVIDTSTGIIYNSISSCIRNTGYKKLIEKLKGSRKNNTSIVYYDS
jgi:hypothetical protein